MLDLFNYKILLVSSDSYIYSRGYRLYQYYCDTNRTVTFGKIKDEKYSLLSQAKLLRRFFRAEITGLYKLKDNSYLAIAKKGIFKKAPESDLFIKCFSVPRGSKPLNLCILPNGHIFFGEYFQNIDKKKVNVYMSEDNGESWNVAYTFMEGNINHIHGLFYDKYEDKLWCLTGDRQNECIIGYTNDEFNTFHEVFRGGQEFRSCNLFFYKSFIVFANDSQYISNELKYFLRETLEIKSIVKIQGSAIKGGQIGNTSFLSTTIEPSEVNKDNYAHIWLTKDGLHWQEIFSEKKDLYPAILQFGTFEFPRYCEEPVESLYINGRALKKIDGRSLKISIC